MKITIEIGKKLNNVLRKEIFFEDTCLGTVKRYNAETGIAELETDAEVIRTVFDNFVILNDDLIQY